MNLLKVLRKLPCFLNKRTKAQATVTYTSSIKSGDLQESLFVDVKCRIERTCDDL